MRVDFRILLEGKTSLSAKSDLFPFYVWYSLKGDLRVERACNGATYPAAFLWEVRQRSYLERTYYTEWSKPERKTPIQYTNAYIWNLERWYGKDNPICEIAKETQMYRTVFWTLWEKARVGWFERIALKHVKYHVWNELPVQVRCTILDAWG